MRLPLNLSIALSSLSAHKWRAILAMVGVFLGALAFTGVEHASKIMAKRTQLETEKLGPNLYVVMAGQIRFRKRGGVRTFGVARNFSLSDAHAVIDGVPSIMEGTPYVMTNMQVRGGGNAITAKLLATEPNYQKIRNFYPESGRFSARPRSIRAPRYACSGRLLRSDCSETRERRSDNPSICIGQVSG